MATSHANNAARDKKNQKGGQAKALLFFAKNTKTVLYALPTCNFPRAKNAK